MNSVGESELPFVRRPDLVIQQLNVGNQVQWTVKDPVALTYFQLREEEHFIFNCLTQGATSRVCRVCF